MSIYILLFLCFLVYINLVYIEKPELENIKKYTNKNYKLILSYSSSYFETNILSYMYEILELSKDLPNINISIKLYWFKISDKLDFNKLEKFVKKATDYKINILFSSMLKKDRKLEIDTYIKLLNKGYKNIFITIATYHNDVNKIIDYILKNNGNIRLVKGWWNDGNINNWDKVTEKYFDNAIKLIKSKRKHILATHDFKLIKKLLDKNLNLDNIEFSFFYFNKKYVNHNLKIIPYKFNNISYYKPFKPNIFTILYNLNNGNFFKNFNLIYKAVVF